MKRDRDDGMGWLFFGELFMRSDRQWLQISEPENSLFLAAKQTVEGKLVVLYGGKCRCNDENVDADVDDFRVIRKCGQTKTKGENHEAGGQQSEFRENTDGNPNAHRKKGETNAFGIKIACPSREEAIRAHQPGNLLTLLMEVFHAKSRIGSTAGAKFVDASHEQTESDPEAEQEIGIGEGTVAAGVLLFGFGHGLDGWGLAWLSRVGEFEKIQG